MNGIDSATVSFENNTTKNTKKWPSDILVRKKFKVSSESLLLKKIKKAVIILTYKIYYSFLLYKVYLFLQINFTYAYNVFK